jgi:hypothetical protein
MQEEEELVVMVAAAVTVVVVVMIQNIIHKNKHYFKEITETFGQFWHAWEACLTSITFLTSEGHIWDDNLLTYTGKDIHIFKQVSIMGSVCHSCQKLQSIAYKLKT